MICSILLQFPCFYLCCRLTGYFNLCKIIYVKQSLWCDIFNIQKKRTCQTKEWCVIVYWNSTIIYLFASCLFISINSICCQTRHGYSLWTRLSPRLCIQFIFRISIAMSDSYISLPLDLQKQVDTIEHTHDYHVIFKKDAILYVSLCRQESVTSATNRHIY